MTQDPRSSFLVPMVVESTHRGERSFDIYSRLLRDRIIMLGTPIDDNVANIVMAQMLFLDSEDAEKPIQLYINSPGGVVTSGLAILDTMLLVKAPVSTICIGQCASMAAVILAAGAKGSRLILPRARVMLHQPSGGAQGQATDIEIQAKEILKMKALLSQIIADCTGRDVEQVRADTERDNFMTAEEALAYGLVDKILTKK